MRESDRINALIVGDQALRLGRPRDELIAVAQYCAGWRGGKQALDLAQFADGRAESGAESLGRLVARDFGLLPCVPQFEIRDARGRRRRLDIAFVDRWTALEPDGKIKYDRPFGDPGAPVIDVDRGGKITWHGYGQLVGYPIVKLSDPIDVVAYVRMVEEAMIGACAELGLVTGRVDGRSGVWVTTGGPDRKVGAIGIRVSRGVTMHGFSINCDNDLAWFDKIVPCGIKDASVTSLSRELGRDVTVREILPLVERHLADQMGAVESLHRTLAQL